MSIPERLLWQHLRGRGLIKVRRQHPIGPYVADFYIASARLVIEIDGEAHNRGDRPARDLKRDAHFRSLGLRILRIPAADVLRDAQATADAIIRTALPVHQPSAGPPPHAKHGEELSAGAV